MKFGFDAHAPGFFWCVGQGGMGIQTAPAASLLCAALVTGQPAPSGIDPADFAPF
jgi:D-arginine dehydrogenase